VNKMDAKSIQQILDEQRKQSELFNKSERQINTKISANIRAADPVYREKLSKSISEKQQDSSYKKHMSDQRKNALDKIIPGEGVTLREKLTVANRNSANNPLHKKNRADANKRTKEQQYWKDAHAAGCLVYSETVITPDGEYASMKKWMDEHNKPGGRSFLKSLPHLFYKKELGKGDPTYERIFNTPYGKCLTTKQAYELSRQNGDPDAITLKNVEGWFLKVATFYPKKFFIKFEIAKYWPDEDSKRPRISKDKASEALKKWNDRLIHHRSLYKDKQ
jgi:hypothetical protein